MFYPRKEEAILKKTDNGLVALSREDFNHRRIYCNTLTETSNTRKDQFPSQKPHHRHNDIAEMI